MTAGVSSLAALLLSVSAAGAQEEGLELPARASVALDAAWWIADFDFDARTPGESVEIDDPSLAGLEISAELEVSEAWSLRPAADVGFGIDMEVVALSLGVAYRPGGLPDPWDLSLQAGLVGGLLRMDDVPGNFDPAVGGEIAATVSRRLDAAVEGLAVRAGLGIRVLRFDFDPDGDVIDADGGAGGAGPRILVGFDYRF